MPATERGARLAVTHDDHGDEGNLPGGAKSTRTGSRLAFEPAARGIINSSAKSNWTICVECPEFDGAARLNASKSK
jgi:hypothetical protein